jgi:hypothetical protein
VKLSLGALCITRMKSAGKESTGFDAKMNSAEIILR